MGQLVDVRQNESGQHWRSEVWGLDHVILIVLFLYDGGGVTGGQVGQAGVQGKGRGARGRGLGHALRIEIFLLLVEV